MLFGITPLVSYAEDTSEIPEGYTPVYTAEDLDCLKQVHLLVKEQGLTLEGASKKLAADRKKVEGRVKVLDSLKAIRSQLNEVRKSL